MFFKFLKASRERVDFKILPIDGAKVCKPIGLDRRQLGLVREEGQFVDIGNMRKKVYFMSLLEPHRRLQQWHRG